MIIILDNNKNKKDLYYLWDDRKDNDFFSCIKILYKLFVHYIVLKNSYFESENEI